jgi:hypothetical protein
MAVAGLTVLLAACGDESVTPPAPDAPASITVTSRTFAEGRPIPADNTCRGAGEPPALAWTGVPPAATSLALVVDDPDAPGGTYVHWVLYDLQPKDGTLAGPAPSGAREAANSDGDEGWTPPCPPSGTHHYRFTVYALDGAVSGDSTQEVLDDIDRWAIASGTLTGVVTG